MRPAKGLPVLAALVIALGTVGAQPHAALADLGSTAQTTVRNLAYANLGKGPCYTTSLGGFFTAADGVASCTRIYDSTGSPILVARADWCGIFASWVWNRSGKVDMTGLTRGHGPDTFDTYGQMTGRLLNPGEKPQVGDVVIFQKAAARGHVAIVYSVDTSALVGTIAGNEGAAPGTVQRRYFNYVTRVSTNPADGYTVYGIARPKAR